MAWKIVTTCDLSDTPKAVNILNKVGELVQLNNDKLIVMNEIEDCDAYMPGAALRVDKELLDNAKVLKLIGAPSTGTDHLDIDLIKKRGIKLFHLAQEYDLIKSFTATSELAFGLILSLIRRIPEALENAKEGIWAREYFTGFQLYGKTLGILGLGRLGKISARIGKGFGMRVIAYDIKDINADGVENVNFKTLLSESDILTIHIHLTPESENMINRDAIKSMKTGAILINTSRGKIINENALIEALNNGHLAGAGLDVIDGEWLSRKELLRHPLIQYAKEHKNIIIVPHIGGATFESVHGARVFMAKKMAEFIRTNW